MIKENHTDQLKEIISTYYAIGDLIDYKQIHIGSVNESYIIKTMAKGVIKKYFFRKYKSGKKEGEIEFEHSIIKHLKQKRFDLVAGLIPTRDRKTFVKQSSGQETFYAIFDFLIGKNRYNWINPGCSKEVLKNAAVVLAKFHSVIFDLKPEHKRCEPKIIDLLSAIAQNLTARADKTENTLFDTCLQENIESILLTIERTLDSFLLGVQESEYKDLVHMVIHCDFHPGNLKFQNDTITGLFDFDWAKVDARCFDVALALTYFCAVWEGNAGGRLHRGKAAVFLHAYQKASTIGIGPLGNHELKYLPYMINAANIYVMNWVIQDYYDRENEVDPRIHLRYLQQNIRVIQWLDRKGRFNPLTSG